LLRWISPTRCHTIGGRNRSRADLEEGRQAIRIIHQFDPFLWQISGNFGIRWYALPYIIGFVLAYLFLKRVARRGEVENLTVETLDTYIVYLFAGVLLGARFFHVFVFEFSNYGFDPLRWIAVWRGGLSFHGGLAGGMVGTYLFSRRYGVSFYALVDRVIIVAAFALGLGRIGNFINGANPPQECRHPTQLYEMVKNWFIMGVLYLEYRYLKPRPGVIFWTFVTLYGLIRFFLMFVRDEVRVFGGLTLSQIFSALMAITGAAVLFWLTSRGSEERAPTG
jgi:phosphatidylglycerol:prolipoprotein diacylglycerol transferase